MNSSWSRRSLLVLAVAAFVTVGEQASAQNFALRVELVGEPYGAKIEGFPGQRLRLPARVVGKTVEVEVGAEYPVEVSQYIQIELCRDASRIVISGVQNRLIFL